MAKPEEWRMIVALPGVDLETAVDGGDLAAIGSKDQRYAQIVETQEGAKEYLSKFKTPFGVALKPTIIAAPDRIPRVEQMWISEFRSIVAVPHVIRGRVDFWAADGGYGGGPPYSDLFDFYPFGLGKDPRYVTLLAAAETGLHMLSTFDGSYPFAVTSSPHHFRPVNDILLSDALLQLWKSRPSNADDEEFRSRVFRSLFLADYSLRAFYASLGSILDAAIPLALFTSAFEPLAAPENVDEDVKARHVVALIEQVAWETPELKASRFRPMHYQPKAGDSTTVTLPGQIYGRLHVLRNRLLHGSPFTELEPSREKDWGDLKVQVPALYRSTLLHVLAERGFGKFETDGFDHLFFEDALLNKKTS